MSAAATESVTILDRERKPGYLSDFVKLDWTGGIVEESQS